MPDLDSFDVIKQIFDQRFEYWGIILPVESLAEQPRGSIHGRGWTINYLCGMDEGVLYLEYYASHRMTNDTLNRIYADGRTELVGESAEFYIVDNEQSKQAYFEHNDRFYEEVRRKGLW